jgi:hypothetical protein
MGLPPTTSKLSTDTSNVTTFNYQFPNFTGSHSGITTSLGVNSAAGGGTGQSSLTLNNVILGNGTSPVQFVAPGSSGNVLYSTGTTWSSAALPASGAFVSYASNVVNTVSSFISSGTFTTFSNSPALTFTPTTTGTYKVYMVPPISLSGSTQAVIRIYNTSGGATLLEESQGLLVGTNIESSQVAQSVYTLTAGTSYQFDIQAKINAGTSVAIDGTSASSYMFAEGIGLIQPGSLAQYAQAYFGPSAQWSTPSATYVDPTFSGTAGFTLRQYSGITLTAAASNICGITFTPASSTAVYFVSAQAAVYNNTSNGWNNMQMIDNNSNVISNSGFFRQAASSNAQTNITIQGIYVPGATSPTTVKLQLAAPILGTAYIAADIVSGNLNNAVEWTVTRLDTAGGSGLSEAQVWARVSYGM